jgi:hypothetical protein
MNNQLYDDLKKFSDIIKLNNNNNLFVKETTTKYDNLKSITENIFGNFSTQDYNYDNGILMLDQKKYSAGWFIFPKFVEIIDLYNLITSNDTYKNYLTYNESNLEDTLKIITDKDIVNAQIETNTIDFFQGISKYVGENFNEILELKLPLISFPGAYLYNQNKNNFNILEDLNDENENVILTFDNIHNIKDINVLDINNSNITNIKIPFLFYTQICGVYTNSDLTKNVISINKLVHQSFLPVLDSNYEYVDNDNIIYIIEQTLIGITLMSIIMFLIDKENNLTTLDYPHVNLSFYQDNKFLTNDIIIVLVKELLSNFTTFKIQCNLHLSPSSTFDTKTSLNINQEKNILFGNFLQDLKFDPNTITSIFDENIVIEDTPIKVDSLFSKYVNSKQKDSNVPKISIPLITNSNFNKSQQPTQIIKLNINPAPKLLINPSKQPIQQPSPTIVQPLKLNLKLNIQQILPTKTIPSPIKQIIQPQINQILITQSLPSPQINQIPITQSLPLPPIIKQQQFVKLLPTKTIPSPPIKHIIQPQSLKLNLTQTQQQVQSITPPINQIPIIQPPIPSPPIKQIIQPQSLKLNLSQTQQQVQSITPPINQIPIIQPPIPSPPINQIPIIQPPIPSPPIKHIIQPQSLKLNLRQTQQQVQSITPPINQIPIIQPQSLKLNLTQTQQQVQSITPPINQIPIIQPPIPSPPIKQIIQPQSLKLNLTQTQQQVQSITPPINQIPIIPSQPIINQQQFVKLLPTKTIPSPPIKQIIQPPIPSPPIKQIIQPQSLKLNLKQTQQQVQSITPPTIIGQQLFVKLIPQIVQPQKIPITQSL